MYDAVLQVVCYVLMQAGGSVQGGYEEFAECNLQLKAEVIIESLPLVMYSCHFHCSPLISSITADNLLLLMRKQLPSLAVDACLTHFLKQLFTTVLLKIRLLS